MEIELKFRVGKDARAALRRAVGTASAQRTPLAAAYHDTADDRLARAGWTLRLRREGAHWVQTLKGRGDGLWQRPEHEVPLAPQRGVPAVDPARHAGSAAGAALAQLLADGAPLVERYRTEVTRLHRRLRRAGSVIEIAYDEGQVIAGAARQKLAEVEFELVSGSPLALIDLADGWVGRHRLLLDPRTKSERGLQLAGAAPLPAAPAAAVHAAMTPAAAFATVVQAALAPLLPAAARLAGGHDAEALHRLRTGLRRLRSLLRELAAWSADPEAALALEASLRQPFQRLGARRDADVMQAWLRPLLEAAQAPPLDWRHDAGDAAGQGGGGDEVVAVVADPGFSRLMLQCLRLAAAAAAPGPTPAAAAPASASLPRPARAVLRRAWRRAMADAQGFESAAAEQRHRLRKRLKRLRFVTEALLPLLPRRAATRALPALRKVLDALGRCNDEEQARAFFAARTGREPAAWFVVGWLAAQQPHSIAAAAHALERLRRHEGCWR